MPAQAGIQAFCPIYCERVGFPLARVGKSSARAAEKQGKSTFDLLGFTHYWARSRQGYWVIKRRTAKKRLRRTQMALWQWCRSHRRRKVEEQHQELCQKLWGH